MSSHHTTHSVIISLTMVIRSGSRSWVSSSIPRRKSLALAMSTYRMTTGRKFWILKLVGLITRCGSFFSPQERTILMARPVVVHLGESVTAPFPASPNHSRRKNIHFISADPNSSKHSTTTNTVMCSRHCEPTVTLRFQCGEVPILV